jgi:3-hydroxyisobutyrate dehydrogenase-like beta-hydroxyacid dehydrogenase
MTWLVLNTWLAMLGEGIAETAVLAQALGVSLNDVSTCIGSTALGVPWALSKLDKIERNAFDPDFSLALASKDLHLALDAANRANRPLPMAQSIATQWESALSTGLGGRDVSGRTWRSQAQIPRAKRDGFQPARKRKGPLMPSAWDGGCVTWKRAFRFPRP